MYLHENCDIEYIIGMSKIYLLYNHIRDICVINIGMSKIYLLYNRMHYVFV